MLAEVRGSLFSLMVLDFLIGFSGPVLSDGIAYKEMARLFMEKRIIDVSLLKGG
jgi:hypothetical protein